VPDLYQNLAAADRFEADFVREIEAYIARTGLAAPKETLPILRDGFAQSVLTGLDLRAAGVTNVIWATSYEFGFSLVRLSIFNADGYPMQIRPIGNPSTKVFRPKYPCLLVYEYLQPQRHQSHLHR
jgi:putative flavoprotein involved in K+ transport